MGSGAEEIIVSLKQTRKRLVEKLPYVTSKGDKVTTLISDLGIFEKTERDGELLLAGCLPYNDLPALAEKIENVRDNCGWELKIADIVRELDPPIFPDFEFSIVYRQTILKSRKMFFPRHMKVLEIKVVRTPADVVDHDQMHLPPVKVPNGYTFQFFFCFPKKGWIIRNLYSLQFLPCGGVKNKYSARCPAIRNKV